MYAVYSAVLRNVSPFDQHQVENSKVISWDQRKSFIEDNMANIFKTERRY